MTASRPVIIKTCPSAKCSTRTCSVPLAWDMLSCGCVVKQRGRGDNGVSLPWSAEGQLIASMSDFPKSFRFFLEAWCLAGPYALSRWRPDTTVSQIASCSSLTLPWSQGEKRCCTSLGVCWWRAARPIRRRTVLHHVTASPIAVYFTIGQMKRLILTICSLMCFFRSFSCCLCFSPTPLLHPHFSTPHPTGCLFCEEGDRILKIICYVGSRFRTQLMRGIMWTGNLNHQLHLLFTIVN